MNEERPAPTVNLSFARHWQAEILPARLLILPNRRFLYPLQAEEVERDALEVLVRPSEDTQPFLATCALGFRDAAVPTGLWSTPNPDEICAISGGYAYIIDTTVPDRFTMIPYRPVLRVIPVPEQNLLLFVGHLAILAWGPNGQAWQSGKLSDEGVNITLIAKGQLHGLGWNMITDKEAPFVIDLHTGTRNK